MTAKEALELAKDYANQDTDYWNARFETYLNKLGFNLVEFYDRVIHDDEVVCPRPKTKNRYKYRFPSIITRRDS